MEATPELPPVITSPEVSEATGYDHSTICRWARSGRLPTIRKLPGTRGAWLFERSVLERLPHK